LLSGLLDVVSQQLADVAIAIDGSQADLTEGDEAPEQGDARGLSGK
jgi:hypothetical protein